MDFDLSPAHQALRERTREMATAFAERADAHDRAAAFPFANFADLRAGGFLGLAGDGERGAAFDYQGFAVATEEIGGACASTGLCYTMHCAGVELARHDTDQGWDSHRLGLMKGGDVWSVGLSEPGSGSHFLVPAMVATTTDRGFILNGTKFFVTSAGGAEHLVVNALVDDDGPDRPTLFIVSPRENPGILVEGDWDPMGMRANDSRTLRFSDCFVAGSNRLGAQGEAIDLIRSRPSVVTLGLGATAVGIAQAAFDIAREHARTRVIATDEGPLSQYQAIRFLVAEMAMAVDSMRLMLRRAAWTADNNPAEAPLKIEAAKYQAATGGFEVANKAMQVVGGRGYIRGHPVERHLRDSRAISLMAATTEQIRDSLGKVLLAPDPEPQPEQA